MKNINIKNGILTGNLKKLDNLIVAFSGGVDSSYLLRAAHDVLGDKAAAVTIDTPFVARAEIENACMFTNNYGIRHYIIKTDILAAEGIKGSPENRCYLCKKHIFSELKIYAERLGFSNIADGTNADDINEYRPGLKALTELDILSPLKEAGLLKEEIRELSKKAGIKGFNRPANSCLATRIPFGMEITKEKLEKIEHAEDYLHNLGYLDIRVRLLGESAKIELPEADFISLTESEAGKAVRARFKSLGFEETAFGLKEKRIK